MAAASLMSIVLHGVAVGGMVCGCWVLAKPREQVRGEKPVVIGQEDLITSAAPPGKRDVAEALKGECPASAGDAGVAGEG